MFECRSKKKAAESKGKNIWNNKGIKRKYDQKLNNKEQIQKQQISKPRFFLRWKLERRIYIEGENRN